MVGLSELVTFCYLVLGVSDLLVLWLESMVPCQIEGFILFLGMLFGCKLWVVSVVGCVYGFFTGCFWWSGCRDVVFGWFFGGFRVILWVWFVNS